MLNEASNKGTVMISKKTGWIQSRGASFESDADSFDPFTGLGIKYLASEVNQGPSTAVDLFTRVFENHEPLIRGFEPKPGGIRIIIFCVTTRLHSKSNRCI